MPLSLGIPSAPAWKQSPGLLKENSRQAQVELANSQGGFCRQEAKAGTGLGGKDLTGGAEGAEGRG